MKIKQDLFQSMNLQNACIKIVRTQIYIRVVLTTKKPTEQITLEEIRFHSKGLRTQLLFLFSALAKTLKYLNLGLRPNSLESWNKAASPSSAWREIILKATGWCTVQGSATQLEARPFIKPLSFLLTSLAFRIHKAKFTRCNLHYSHVTCIFKSHWTQLKITVTFLFGNIFILDERSLQLGLQYISYCPGCCSKKKELIYHLSSRRIRFRLWRYWLEMLTIIGWETLLCFLCPFKPLFTLNAASKLCDFTHNFKAACQCNFRWDFEDICTASCPDVYASRTRNYQK